MIAHYIGIFLIRNKKFLPIFNYYFYSSLFILFILKRNFKFSSRFQIYYLLVYNFEVTPIIILGQIFKVLLEYFITAKDVR